MPPEYPVALSWLNCIDFNASLGGDHGSGFAGTMGYLGMAVTLLRGACAGAGSGAGIEATLTNAIVTMIAMAIVGGVVGAIAERTVDESVRSQLERQLADASDASDSLRVAAS